MKTKEEKAAYQRLYYLQNLEHRKLQSNKSYHKNKNMKTKEELAKISLNHYYNNKEKLSAYRKIKYLEKNGIVKVAVIKRTLPLETILKTLQKDKKHELWNKSVRQWSINDWDKFNKI